MVNIVKNAGKVKVIQPIDITQQEDDNFILQRPIIESDNAPVTKFVFECDIPTDELHQPASTIMNSNALTTEEINQDDFSINDPGEHLVTGVNIKKSNTTGNKNNRFDNLNNVPSTTDITKSISKVSNMIRDSLKQKNVYNKINHGKIRPQDFYIKISNSIWKSLLQLCNIIQGDQPNNFDIPVINNETKYLETWRFFDRIYHDTRVSIEKDPMSAIAGYKSTFGIDSGITNSWIPLLTNKIQEKLNLAIVDIHAITKIIENDWCYIEPTESIDVINTEITPSTMENNTLTEMAEKINNVSSMINENHMHDNCECNHEDDGECCCDEDDEDYDTEYDNDDEDDDEYNDNNNESLTVTIQTDEDIDESIIAITAWNGTSMMLYADMNNINLMTTYDKRPWGWLRHFIPNAVIITENPDDYLKYNDILGELKFAPLKMTRAVTGEDYDNSTIMGLYYIDDDLNDMNDTNLQKINTLIEQNTLKTNNLSHLDRTLQMDRLIVDEDSILECIQGAIDEVEYDDIFDNIGNAEDYDDNEDDEDDDEYNDVCDNEIYDAENDEDCDDDHDSILAYAASIVSSYDKPAQYDVRNDAPEIIINSNDCTAPVTINAEDDKSNVLSEAAMTNDGSTIGEYVREKYNMSDDVVFTPIRKDRSNSKYHDAE